MIADGVCRPLLSVIQGGGSSETARRPELVSVPPLHVQSQAWPKQLELPGIPRRPQTLISVGIDSIDFSEFKELIKQNSVRRIIDCRLSPSFGGRGFNALQTFDLFRRLGIEYEHAHELTNQFLGESWYSHITLHRYAAFLESSTDQLKIFRKKIENGPTILLGNDDKYGYAEREMLIEALIRISPRFDLYIASHPQRYENYLPLVATP